MEMILPHDIAAQVFIRLPIQSIVDCKLVCKAWFSILKDPYFALQHVIYRRICGGGDHYVHDHGFLLIVRDLSITYFSLFYHEHGNHNKENRIGLYMPPIKRISHPAIKKNNFQSRSKVIISSCNGLICCSFKTDGDPISICNPVTHEYLCLPNSWDRQKYACTGFGYHYSTNEYKVVRILGVYAVKQVQVYTLGGTSDEGWRDKDDISYPFSTKRGIFLNGEIYWLCYDRKIVAFNVADEKFREFISLPPDINDYVLYLEFFELDGCLCVLERLLHDHKDDVWLLRKRTVNDVNGQECHTWSWIKEFSVPTTMSITPLSITKGGGLLMWQGGECVCYDPKHGTKQHIGYSNNGNIVDAIPHINSLVSLKALVGERPADRKKENCQ